MNRIDRTLFHAAAGLLISCSALLAQSSLTQSPASPSDPAELVKQARRLNGEGKQDEALAFYRRALETSPDLFDARLGIGTVFDLNSEYGEARKHLARAIELARPEARVQALKAMAISYAFTREAANASKFEQQAFNSQIAAQNFTAAAETANELARIYLESGDLDNAPKWYEIGHETAFRKPDMPAAEKDLWEFRWEHAQARIAVRRGRLDAANKHVAAAKAILDRGTNPEQARFYPYLTGYIAFYASDYKTALAELQKADQRDPFILSLIAQAYEKSGDAAQAVEYYRKVLSSNAHNPTNAFARPLAKEKLAARSQKK